MATPTTTCLRCGVEILTGTAERTGGICRPCERGWRNSPSPPPFADCVEGVLTFVADTQGTEHYHDVISTGVSRKDLSHYVLLSRSLPIGGDEDEGVHVEVDDQINSGYNLVKHCTLSPSRLELLFTRPVDPGREVLAISATLAIPNAEFHTLHEAFLKVFQGLEPLLTIGGGA